MTEDIDLTLHNDFGDNSILTSNSISIWNTDKNYNPWDDIFLFSYRGARVSNEEYNKIREHEKFFGYSETHVSQADSIFLNSRQERYKENLNGKIPWNKSTPMRDSRDILNMR